MAASPDRASYFPAIERKYGQPMSYWHGLMAERKGQKYPELMAYLQEEHGFSRTHANALVQYSRGSTSSQRFATLDEYLAPHPADAQETARGILDAITSKYPRLETVIAWNQPQLRLGTQYVFGLSVLARYVLMAPHGEGIIDEFADRLDSKGLERNKKTIKVPFGWKVDKGLLREMAAARIAHIEQRG